MQKCRTSDAAAASRPADRHPAAALSGHRRSGFGVAPSVKCEVATPKRDRIPFPPYSEVTRPYCILRPDTSLDRIRPYGGTRASTP
jgi:hypothetical protein